MTTLSDSDMGVNPILTTFDESHLCHATEQGALQPSRGEGEIYDAEPRGCCQGTANCSSTDITGIVMKRPVHGSLVCG